MDLRHRAQRLLRWRAAPAAFGVGFYAVSASALLLGVAQTALLVREATGALCSEGDARGPVFATSEPCHDLGVRLARGRPYRVRIVVVAPWMDRGVPASPAGFTAAQGFSRLWAAGRHGEALRDWTGHLLGAAFRREVPSRWFAPVVAIRDGASPWLYKMPLSLSEGDDGAFYARFVAPTDGNARIYVNDAILPWAGADRFYSNNAGTARLDVTQEN